MPTWSQFRKKYSFEPEDLPVQAGPNVVVIEGTDSEEAHDFTSRVPYTRHLLRLAGWEQPLRLNNTRTKILEAMFGPNTEDAIGRRIVLVRGVSQEYGQVRPVIQIHPDVPRHDAPVTPVPHRLATRSAFRLDFARAHGVPIEPPQGALPAGNSRYAPPGVGYVAPDSRTAAPHATPPGAVHGASGATIGAEAAAELMLLLRERNRSWDFLVHHLRTQGMEGMLAGRLPPDADAAIRGPAWSLLRSLPIVAQIDDRAAAKRAILDSWRPPPPTQTPPASPVAPAVRVGGDVIDSSTGEVVRTDAHPPAGIPGLGAVPADDIPF